MGYYDESYILDDNYGDEDQNALMWLINSWRSDDEPEDDISTATHSIHKIEIVRTATKLVTVTCPEDDELPF